jgi:drug/metabolite transporter (DMT)-like permease
MKQKQMNGNIYIVIAALLWSFGGAFTKLIPWGPISIACIRALIAAIVFAIYRKKISVRFTKYNIIGGLAVFFTTFCFICSNKYTTAANAIVLQYTMPIYIIIFNSIIRKNKPTLLDILAVLGTMLGIAVFFIDSIGAGNLFGNIMGLLSGLSFAIVLFVSSNSKVNPIDLNYIGNLIYIVLIPLIFLDKSFHITIYSTSAVLFLGIVQLGIAYIFFSKGIQKTSPISAALIAALEPILNPVWALLMIGEKPSLLSVIAGFFVILIITIYNILKVRTSKSIQQHI